MKPALSETLSETLSDSQRAELTARFVSILQHFLSSRALRQWHWISTRQKHAIAELRAGLLAFRNPQLRKGFSTWRGAHEDALKARQTLALGSSQIVKLELRRGYRAFERVLAKARRKRELEVRCEAVMRHFIRPRMQLPFNLWHEQQMATEMERKLKEGLCCALGYWLRTSCGRCACRQIPVPPQTARKPGPKACGGFDRLVLRRWSHAAHALLSLKGWSRVRCVATESSRRGHSFKPRSACVCVTHGSLPGLLCHVTPLIRCLQ